MEEKRFDFNLFHQIEGKSVEEGFTIVHKSILNLQKRIKVLYNSNEFKLNAFERSTLDEIYNQCDKMQFPLGEGLLFIHIYKMFVRLQSWNKRLVRIEKKHNNSE